MGKPTYNRNIVTGSALKNGIDNAIAKIEGIALSAYGIQSGNVMIENRADPPTISHDGVTNIGVLEVSDPIEDMTIATIKQAAERTNKTAGDGTTLTTILSCELYKWAKEKMEKDGLSPLATSKLIEEAMLDILNEIDATQIKTGISNEELLGACIVSAGDEGLGNLVYDVMSQVGAYGGVNIIYTGNIGTSTEITNGLYIPKGMTSEKLFNNKSEKRTNMSDTKSGVPIVILSNTITKKDELADICDKIRTMSFPQVVFIGDINGDALNYLELVSGRNLLDVAVVRPPAESFQTFLEDIALYTGGKVYSGITSEWSIDFMGKTQSVNITSRETTIIGGAGEDSKEIKSMVSELKDKARKAAPGPERTSIEARIARLTAKVANIYVGGTGAAERGEIKLRVEDAVCAAKSAIVSGIVPGGGVCLRDVYYTLRGRDENKKYDYLLKPYSYLVREYAGLITPGIGIDIKTMKEVNMLNAFIVDPAIVIKEAVRNSHSIVSKLITTNLALVFEDRTWEF